MSLCGVAACDDFFVAILSFDYDNGDILLSLEFDDTEGLRTQWQRISCMQNNRYFQKIYNNYCENGKIINIDAFVGKSNRVIGNLIQ